MKNIGSTLNTFISGTINAPKRAMNAAEVALGRPGRLATAAGIIAGGVYATDKVGTLAVQQLPKSLHAVASQVGPANTAVSIFEEAGKVVALGAGTLMAAGLTLKSAHDFLDFATTVSRRQTTFVEIKET